MSHHHCTDSISFVRSQLVKDVLLIQRPLIVQVPVSLLFCLGQEAVLDLYFGDLVGLGLALQKLCSLQGELLLDVRDQRFEFHAVPGLL